jgi:hypothetical protein
MSTNEVISESFFEKLSSKVSNFLFFCAGADTKILAECTHTDKVKSQGIGGVVLATAVLAFFSGSYAFYTVFSPKQGMAMEAVQQASNIPVVLFSGLFGLVWALMIFNLDRFIVATSGHGDGTEKITLAEFGRGIPRIIMAIMIGLILSKPLELRIMESEIEAQLQLEQEAHVKKRKANLDEEYDKAGKALDSKRAEAIEQRNVKEQELKKLKIQVDSARMRLEQEIDGESANGKKGEGPAAKQKRETQAKAEAEFKETEQRYQPILNNLKQNIDQVQAEIDALMAKRADDLKLIKVEAAKKDGLIERIYIAEEIAPTASKMLTALLIILEIAPILFKMMLSLSPYDYLTENAKRKVIARRAIDIKTMLSQDTGEKIMDVKNATYHEADLIAAHDIGKVMIEDELTKKAQELFLAQVKADIERDPSKYISQDVIQELRLPVAKEESDKSSSKNNA